MTGPDLDSLPPEARLARDLFLTLNGVWRFELWSADNSSDEPDSRGERVNTLIFNGLKMSFQERFERQLVQVRGIMSYDWLDNRYTLMGVASTLPGVDLMRGHLTESGRLFLHTLRRADDPPARMYRTILEIKDRNSYHVSSFVEEDDGAWQPMYQVMFQRRRR